MSERRVIRSSMSQRWRLVDMFDDFVDSNTGSVRFRRGEVTTDSVDTDGKLFILGL